MGRREEDARATRESLVAAALELFSEKGYDEVGTEEIVERARVTRGALYHHFEDKRDLFRAVHERVETEFVERIAASMQEASDDPWEVIVTGIRAVLDACREPRVTQVALVDAPSVLGWREWREVEESYGLGLLRAALGGAKEAGLLVEAPLDSLSHLMLAALIEAAFMITYADDPDAVSAEAEQALLALLEGLRA